MKKKWWQFKTWLRIQWRMFLIHFSEVYNVLERPLVVTVNWLILLSAPVWVGIAYVIITVHRAWQSKKNVERRVLLGKIWYWESFKLY